MCATRGIRNYFPYGEEADFEAPSSDDVDELGRSRGSQMTSHTSIIGHGRRKRGGERWEQHRAPLDAFSRLACQSELELAIASESLCSRAE